MAFLSHKIDKSDLKAGDHIYTYRAKFLYSYHGIYLGDDKVVSFTHVTRELEKFKCRTSSPTCGFIKHGSLVVQTCFECFLRNGALYRFEYGVSPTVFFAHVRGGTCTLAKSDDPATVIYRVQYLLNKGFGNYDLLRNNCEDFCMYCKTGMYIVSRLRLGRRGQISSIVTGSLNAFLAYRLRMFIPNLGIVAALATGLFSIKRYASDIGIRADVVKVDVEHLDVTLDEMYEDNQDNEASSEIQ